jgi:hypothetical protein
VIRGYSVRRFNEFGWDYRVIGAGIRFRTLGGQAYCGESAGRCAPTTAMLLLEYRQPAAAQASAIERIAQTHMPKAHTRRSR